MRRFIHPVTIVAVLALVGGVTTVLISAWPQDSARQASEVVAPHVEHPPAVARNEPAGMPESDAVQGDAGEGAVREGAGPGLGAGAASLSGADGGSAAQPGPTSGGDKSGNESPGQDEAMALPEKADLKYSGLGSRLNALVACAEEAESSAEGTGLQPRVRGGASVAVTIHLYGNVDEVVRFLEENGGDPRNVGEDYIEAYVPLALLGAVSLQEGVTRVREIGAVAPDGTAAGPSSACDGDGLRGGQAPSP